MFRRLYWWWHTTLARSRVRWFLRDHRVGRCLTCRRPACLVWTPCMTAYVDDTLNEDGFKCRSCRHEYMEYWQERWDEYNSGRL